MKDLFITYNLKDIYHDLGQYSFKVVLSPEHFKNGRECLTNLVDSDGKSMDFHVEVWGRKMNFTFTINENVPDGVSVLSLSGKTSSGKEFKEHIKFWVVKP